MSISNLYPSIAPSLSLDFSNVGALDPRITFVRTTTATYYGTDTAKAEENLILQSQTFDNASWARANATVTANTTTAPDGTATADTLTEDSATLIHLCSQTVSRAGVVTLSVFAKLGSGTRFLTIGLSRDTTNTASATFDLSLGTSTQTQANGTYSSSSATITAVAESFFRCTLTVTTDTATQCRIGLNDTGTPTTSNRGFGANYTGDNTSSLILWGAQLEQRSAVTSYTPTTTQPITNFVPVLEVAAAGEARFDHNPLTFESLGLLVEQQRTNLILRSEEFDDAGWTKTRSSITANTIVAPDGTLTGDKLVEDTTASNSHLVTQASLSFTSGTSHTLSVYAKAAGRTGVRILLPTAAFGANVSYNFFLDTATFAQNTAGTNDSASITSVGNGWFRCTVTAQATATSTGTIQFLLLVGGNASYTGDGFSGIFIWGAQLEVGAFPTSYIQTVAATVTRNADVASMTGTNFSSWYRAAEGSLYAEWQKFAPLSFQSVVVASDGTSSNVIAIAHGSISGSNNNLRLDVVTGGVSQASITTITNSPSNIFAKTVAAYAVNDFSVVSNGGTAATDTSGVLPVVNRLGIGANAAGTGAFLNGTIKKLSFYPSRLSNAQLQALTTV